MTLDDRLNALNQWLDETTAGSSLDPNDLERRRRRQRTRQASAFASVIAILAIGTLALAALRNSDSSQLAAGSSTDDATASTESAPVPGAENLPAFVLDDSSPDRAVVADETGSGRHDDL